MASMPHHADSGPDAQADLADGRPPGRMFSCNAYGNGKGFERYRLADVPPRWWRKIELDYADGERVVLVYLAEPADPSELPELMWKLQCAAGRYGFRVAVITSDGRRTEAPPVRTRRGRRGRRR
jgi:hypothetical protein